eukprot:GGOE01007136.1.p1 GENE.GGOE01007136.1~~GGOE01007136.1.p1  ORF type:complete len:278 (-),score=34.11 GGOE01007136.1:476-1309(-)
MTPDPVKIHVLWELYWALRLQFLFCLRQHHRRCVELLVLRQECAKDSKQCAPFNSLAVEDDDASHFAKLDATLFIETLRRPVFRYIPGQQIKFSELVKLSNAIDVFHEHWSHVSPALRHVSPVLLAFLKSPLCIEADWLQQRFATPGPVVPLLSWLPPHPPVKRVVCRPRPSPLEPIAESRADSDHLPVSLAMPIFPNPSKRQAVLLNALKGSEQSKSSGPPHSPLPPPHMPSIGSAPRFVGKLPELQPGAPHLTMTIVTGSAIHSASRLPKKASKY